MKIRPLYDRIVVKRAPDEKTTASGIVIPDSAKEKPEHGEVVAVGNGRLAENGSLHPLQVKIGDVVLFGKYSGTPVDFEGEEYLFIKEEEILGVVSSDRR